MPAKSKKQYHLMSSVKKCKLGKNKYCNDRTKKMADSMNMKDLNDFLNTDYKKLPHSLKESVVYSKSNINDGPFFELKDWLGKYNIDYIEDDDTFEILNLYKLDKDNKIKSVRLINDTGLKQIWENVTTSVVGQSTDATLADTLGVGSIIPPKSGGIKGSGDNFGIPLLTNNYIKHKKKKANKYIEEYDNFNLNKKRI